MQSEEKHHRQVGTWKLLPVSLTSDHPDPANGRYPGASKAHTTQAKLQSAGLTPLYPQSLKGINAGIV